jgi:hypothetical protein
MAVLETVNQLVYSIFLQKEPLKKTEAVFVVVCDPLMNELRAT